MKTLFYMALILLFCWGVLYLAGSFYAASFNIALWPEGTRGVVAVFCVIATVFAVVIVALAQGAIKPEED